MNKRFTNKKKYKLTGMCKRVERKLTRRKLIHTVIRAISIDTPVTGGYIDDSIN